MYYLIIVTRLVIDKYAQIVLVNENDHNRKDSPSLTIWANSPKQEHCDLYKDIIEALNKMDLGFDLKYFTDPIYIPKELLKVSGHLIHVGSIPSSELPTFVYKG